VRGGAPRPRTVLVVDDEADLADLAALLLAQHGFEVAVAYSGEQALHRLSAGERFDALFSDVTMAGLNGLELAAAVSRLAPSTRIVLTSGYTLPSLLAEHRGKWGCIQKPYRIEAVVAMLCGPQPMDSNS